jgi:hypothetical protein
VTGGETAGIANDQMNNVNYESEGEQLAEGQKKPTTGGTQKAAG